MFGTARKDAAFFDAFSAHADKTVEAARLLVQIMDRLTAQPDAARNDDGDLASLATRIKECETAGDTITHQTMKRLRENWITPLDRSDIHDIISRLDDVLDAIEEAAERIVLFEVTTAPLEAHELSELLVQSSTAVSKAVGLLRDLKRAAEVRQVCVEINELENVADQIHRRAIAALFKRENGNDPLIVMKWRDIFDSLETAADRCEDVADVIEGVVLEYG